MMSILRTRHRPAAARGQVVAFVAILLQGLVLLGLVTWAVSRQFADDGLVTRLATAAAYAGASVLAGPDLAGDTPLLACASGPCTVPTAVSCHDALADDPTAHTAAGLACRTFALGLWRDFPDPHGPVDVDAALAATRVYALPPLARDPEDPQTQYHYPTVLVIADVDIGFVAHDGLRLRHHVRGRAQSVSG